MKVPFLKKSFKYLGNFGEGLRLKKDNLSRWAMVYLHKLTQPAEILDEKQVKQTISKTIGIFATQQQGASPMMPFPPLPPLIPPCNVRISSSSTTSIFAHAWFEGGKEEKENGYPDLFSSVYIRKIIGSLPLPCFCSEKIIWKYFFSTAWHSTWTSRLATGRQTWSTAINCPGPGKTNNRIPIKTNISFTKQHSISQNKNGINLN